MSVINSYSSANKIKKRFTAKEKSIKISQKGKERAFSLLANWNQ
jgi:hypothetical protein